MKIIKHGKKYDDGSPFTGKCYCHCEVEVTRDEISYEPDCRDGDYYYVRCPECDGIIYITDERL